MKHLKRLNVEVLNKKRKQNERFPVCGWSEVCNLFDFCNRNEPVYCGDTPKVEI